MDGQLVRWMEVGFREAGIYSSREKAVYWDGKSQDGERVSSGVCFYSLELGAKSHTRRMVILRSRLKTADKLHYRPSYDFYQLYK